jgi:hypothetical protein
MFCRELLLTATAQQQLNRRLVLPRTGSQLSRRENVPHAAPLADSDRFSLVRRRPW